MLKIKLIYFIYIIKSILFTIKKLLNCYKTLLYFKNFSLYLRKTGL